MNAEPASIKITIPADYLWQHLVIEGDEEQCLEGVEVEHPLPVKNVQPADGASTEPTPGD